MDSESDPPPPRLPDPRKDLRNLFEMRDPPRLGIEASSRVMTASTSAFVAGMALGAYHGTTITAFQFRAENAHRFPTSSTGWYQYHKSKNYTSVLGGLKHGVRMGGKLGAGSLMFCLFEETVDHARDKRDFLSTVTAGLAFSGVYSLLARHDMYTAARTAKLGLKLSLTYGLMQDALSTMKGNPPRYLDFIIGKSSRRSVTEDSSQPFGAHAGRDDVLGPTARDLRDDSSDSTSSLDYYPPHRASHRNRGHGGHDNSFDSRAGRDDLDRAIDGFVGGLHDWPSYRSDRDDEPSLSHMPRRHRFREDSRERGDHGPFARRFRYVDSSAGFSEDTASLYPRHTHGGRHRDTIRPRYSGTEDSSEGFGHREFWERSPFGARGGMRYDSEGYYTEDGGSSEGFSEDMASLYPRHTHGGWHRDPIRSRYSGTEDSSEGFSHREFWERSPFGARDDMRYDSSEGYYTEDGGSSEGFSEGDFSLGSRGDSRSGNTYGYSDDYLIRMFGRRRH
ncbi:hypothetical protein FQN54_004998 [Arachnomyces sp. PD_36]|nr:hypothetical protein FQN54_004998 [Arachnomyces sp. PD_36]